MAAASARSAKTACTTAAESGTGGLLGAAIGPYRCAEQPLALDLLGCFGPGMLVLADRKFPSWSLARAFLATGAHILWRVPEPARRAAYGTPPGTQAPFTLTYSI